MIDKVFEFWYNDCIHESAAACISLHRTKKGAEIALMHHKEERRNLFDEMYAGHTPALPFGTHEAWGVVERDIVE